jgi:ferredoxin
MKAHVALGIDGGQQGCTGHGRCAVMAGDVYELDDNGYNLARGGFVEVPAGLEDTARLGARVCPERVITIEE